MHFYGIQLAIPGNQKKRRGVDVLPFVLELHEDARRILERCMEQDTVFSDSEVAMLCKAFRPRAASEPSATSPQLQKAAPPDADTEHSGLVVEPTTAVPAGPTAATAVPAAAAAAPAAASLTMHQMHISLHI